MGRKQQKEEEFSFEDILEELQSITKEIECGSYRVKELTMHHQRKSLTAGMEPVEAPVRLNNLFSDYILENVELINDYGSIGDIVTIAERPYLINLLRKVTLGEEYIVDDKTYKMYEVTDKDFEEIGEGVTSFECGNLIVNLKYPTINEDKKINESLSNELTPYKNRRLNDNDYGNITVIYSLYEIMKYIDSIEINGNVTEFSTVSISNRKKFIDRLHLRYIELIGNFMAKVKSHEEKCFTAFNPEKEDDVVSMDASMLFSAKNTQ